MEPPAPPPLQYEVPEWSAPPSTPTETQWNAEVLKKGSIVETLDLSSSPDLVSKPFLTCGRLPICDVSLEHPSISRYHAILQFRSDGALFVYDLGSAHGTRLNKKRIDPRVYCRIYNGNFLVFGESTRSYIFQCNDPQQDEPTMSAAVPRPIPEGKSSTASNGATWGMRDDSEEDEDVPDVERIENPMETIQAFTPNPDDFYQRNPLRTLQEWVEFYGYDDLQFDVQEEKKGREKMYVASLILRIAQVKRPLGFQGTALTKKDAQVEAAREACHALQALQLLKKKDRSAGGKFAVDDRKRKQEYYQREDREREEDDYYDRSKKVEKKKRTAAAAVETFESLMHQWTDVARELHETKGELELASKQSAFKEVEAEVEEEGGDEDDDLDAFMNQMKTGLQQEMVEKLQRQILDLEEEQRRLEKLLRVAEPKAGEFLRQADMVRVSLARGAAAIGNQKAKLPPDSVQPPPPTSQPPQDDFALAKSQHQVGKETAPESKSKSPSSPSKQHAPPSLEKPTAQRPIAGPSLTPEQYAMIRTQQKQQQPPTEADGEKQEATAHFVEAEEDVTEWLPPQDQQGDGTTALNKKLGY